MFLLSALGHAVTTKSLLATEAAFQSSTVVHTTKVSTPDWPVSRRFIISTSAAGQPVKQIVSSHEDEHMSCILRISGDTLDVDALLSECSIPVDRIWIKGEPRTLRGKFYSSSGANFLASDADLDEFDRQVSETTEFLKSHSTSIAKLAEFPGVQYAVLDFGVCITEGNVAQFSYFSPSFIQFAATAKVGLEVSHYACSEEDEES